MNDESNETISLLRKLVQRIESIESRLDSVDARLGETDTRHNESQTNLTSRALTLTAPEDEDVLLGLDFGTARSKAFATDGEDDNLVDLAVGSRAGGDSVHSILSCVYIDDDGKIYFGDVAAAKSELLVARGVRKRIDSLKSIITNVAPGTDLRASPCASGVNPTTTPFSEADVLTLYLAYLTDLAGLELSERHGLSRYVKRRFTTPVFTKSHLQWASETLHTHYCEAILVADHFSGRWDEGIDIVEARSVVQAARAQSDRVDYLVERAVVEPVAAFASRFRNYEAKESRRLLITIADIGAGTTDFASFAFLEDPARGIKLFQVPGSIHVVRRAGNEIDRLLHDYILDKVRDRHTGLGSELLDRIKAQLSLDQRRLKEELFMNGWCEYKLSDDTRGEVRLEDFLKAPSVERFEAELREEFERSLQSIAPSWIADYAQGQLVVVLTGGGATLPMAKQLGKAQIDSLSQPTECRAGPSIPAWVNDNYPELAKEFTQLAVALGGASRGLPDLAAEVFSDFKGLSEQGKWVIPPAYKGS